MKVQKPLITLVGGLFLLGAFWRNQMVPQLPVANAAPTSSPLPKVVFEPDLTLNGSVLSGHVTLYAAPNLYRVMETTAQTLTIGNDRNVRPYPQYQIENVANTYSRAQGFPTFETPSGLVKTSQIGLGKTDLKRELENSQIRFVRLQVVVTQGPNDPKYWTTANAITYFSQWLPYKRG